MNNYKEHQTLAKKVKLALQKKYPKARIFDRHVGKFIFLRFITNVISGRCDFSDWKKFIVSINKKGMSDMWMIYNGSHFEIEIKTGKAVQTKEQVLWQKTVESCGCTYLIVREMTTIEDLEL